MSSATFAWMDELILMNEMSIKSSGNGGLVQEVSLIDAKGNHLGSIYNQQGVIIYTRALFLHLLQGTNSSVCHTVAGESLSSQLSVIRATSRTPKSEGLMPHGKTQHCDTGWCPSLPKELQLMQVRLHFVPILLYVLSSTLCL